MSGLKVVVVLPAYNAERTLVRTLDDLPGDVVDEVIIVDDKSRYDTVNVARRVIEERKDQHIVVFEHGVNRGYGANQKTCYQRALERDADIVVMVHPDYQYDPKMVRYLVGFIRDGNNDVMLGSRIRTRREALDGGMPVYKYFANRALTFWQNLVSGQNLSEWHTGMRAYSARALSSTDFQNFSDDFVFDTQMLFALVALGARIGDIPVPVRYFPEASSIDFRRSCVYGLRTVWESFKFLGLRVSGNLTEYGKDKTRA